MSGKVFVYHDGALGDLLLSLRPLALIRSHFRWLHLACRPDAGELLLNAGCVDAASSTEGGFFLSLYEGETDARLEQFLRGFDAAYVFTVSRDSHAVTAIARVVPETIRIFTIPPEGQRMHVTAFRMSQVGQEARRDEKPGPLLKIPELLRREAQRLAGPGPVITVHPGSGGARKCWPLAKYFVLIEELKRLSSAPVVILSGPAEEDKAPLIADFAASVSGTVHLHGLELTHLAALLSISDVYVGNDSGISHLAASVGAPAVVIFGPTDPELWRPMGEKVIVEKAMADCAPCGDVRSRACTDRRCLDGVSLGRVLIAAETLLRKKSRDSATR